jgi:hypothetical protein
MIVIPNDYKIAVIILGILILLVWAMNDKNPKGG